MEVLFLDRDWQALQVAAYLPILGESTNQIPKHLGDICAVCVWSVSILLPCRPARALVACAGVPSLADWFRKLRPGNACKFSNSLETLSSGKDWSAKSGEGQRQGAARPPSQDGFHRQPEHGPCGEACHRQCSRLVQASEDASQNAQHVLPGSALNPIFHFVSMILFLAVVQRDHVLLWPLFCIYLPL